MNILLDAEIEEVSGGIFPAIALYAGAAFVAGVTAGIAAAAAAKSDN